MSLKAKIEAVIYASEDPVTLAQLTGLLSHEGQSELDLLDAAQQRLTLVPHPPEGAGSTEPVADDHVDEAAESPDQDALNAEVLDVAAQAEPAAGAEAPEVAGTGAVEDAHDAARDERDRAKRLRAHFRAVLEELMAEYANSDRGLEIREVAGGFRFATKAEYHDAVRGFVKSLKPPLKLSLQALETLAVVAYKQPVTAPEISEIRGVDSGGVLGSLMSRKLVTTAGRKHVIGRPILYKTTREFLLKFGLKDVAELPSIEEFEKLAGALAEQEEIPMDDEMKESPKTVEERLESDGEESPSQPVADEVLIDGRASGLPPAYDETKDDPSAEEAAIQESGA